MANRGLEVRVHTGVARPGVREFAGTLTKILGTLRAIDELYAPQSPAGIWVVADLFRQVADAVVRLEPRPGARAPEDLLVPAEALVEGVDVLAEGPVIPNLYPADAVTSIVWLSRPRNGIDGVSLATYNGQVGREHTISEAVGRHAAQAVQGRSRSYGSVTGTVNVLSGKGRTLRGSINDPSSGRPITVVADRTLAEQLRGLWLHRVLAGGWLTRNSSGQVVRIELERLEPLPEDDRAVPRTADLLGLLPGWIDGQGTDAYIERVRVG